MSKPIKPAKQPTTPTGNLSGNFAQVGEEFLQASKFIHDGFKVPKWPTYQAAFQGLENFLKAYLLLHNGVTLDQANELGHNLKLSLKEAKANGLVLKVAPEVEEAVMKISQFYTDGQSRYAPGGDWRDVPPHLVISFVDQVRRDARL